MLQLLTILFLIPFGSPVAAAEPVIEARVEAETQIDSHAHTALEAGRRGLSVEELQERLRARLEGLHAGTIYSGVRRIPIMLRGSPFLRESPIDFVNLQLSTSRSEPIPLSQVATLRRVEGPVQINREGASRLVVVTANVRGRDLVGFVENAKRRVEEEITLPAGSRIEWGGQFENQQRASARLALAVPVSLTLIFLLLLSTFRCGAAGRPHLEQVLTHADGDARA
jgi:cobalt-zinc-cadmium resistance protein CzcA